MKKNNSIAQQKTVSFIPDQPELGYSKIYAKDDNNWYYLDDTGIERSFVTSEDINQPPAVVTFAQAATGAGLLYTPVYNNGPLNDGVGATLTATSPGIVSDGTSSGKIDFTYTPVNGGIILVWYENASTNPALNRQFTHGLYEITDTGSPSTNYVLTRLAEFDESAELFPLQVNITDGTNYLGKYFIQKTPSPILGTDKLIFVISSNQNATPPIAFVDTATTTALPACTYAPGTALTSLPGSGATLTANLPGALGVIGGLTADTSTSSITGFTRVLVKDQAGPLAYQNGDYQVINKGSVTQKWVLRRIQNWAGGFSRYTRFFLVSNTGSTQAGKLYFTTPTSPALTNATIGTAPINIVEYGGSGGGGGVIAVGSASGSTVRIGNSNSAACLYSTVSGGQCNTAQGCHATISGGSGNTANGSGSINGGFSNLAYGGGSIGGGTNNSASAVYATIGGGQFNTICAGSSCATIGGGRRNIVNSVDSAISGGGCNTIDSGGSAATISGGYLNQINVSSTYATISGGWCNNICNLALYSVIGGGYQNKVCSSRSGSTIGGGYLNQIDGTNATIGGGTTNYAACNESTVGGGILNGTGGIAATVGGGRSNTANGTCSTIGGGYGNFAIGKCATVSGGYRNIASGASSIIAGGWCNCTCTLSSCATIGGGLCNTASGCYSIIGGGASNRASGLSSTVSGGCNNTASYYCVTIGGGCNNTASGLISTISGGKSNTASAIYATVGGGLSNIASNTYATIGGGRNNTACFSYSTVSGGRTNTASGNYSNVGGGYFNIASGSYSTVLGGGGNCAALSNITSGDRSAILGGSGNNMTCNYSGAFGCNITSVAACTFHVNNLSVYNTPAADETNTAVLVREVSTGLIKTRTLPAAATYGLYTQTNTSTPITATDSELSLLDGGLGTLTIPANGFKVGDSFTGVLIGHLSCVGTATLQIRVKTASGILLADTGAMAMSLTANKHWKLNVDFTVRQLGAATVASIASGGLFAYTKNSGLNFEGVNFSLVENTTFDTTILNTLVITAQWNTNNAGNSIYSEIFTLSKTY